jgi:hypothetical protein
MDKTITERSGSPPVGNPAGLWVRAPKAGRRPSPASMRAWPSPAARAAGGFLAAAAAAFSLSPRADPTAPLLPRRRAAGSGPRGLTLRGRSLAGAGEGMDLKKLRLTWTKVHVTRWQANVSVGSARGINLPHRAVRGPGPWTTSPRGRVSLRLIGSNPARNEYYHGSKPRLQFNRLD